MSAKIIQKHVDIDSKQDGRQHTALFYSISHFEMTDSYKSLKAKQGNDMDYWKW